MDALRLPNRSSWADPTASPRLPADPQTITFTVVIPAYQSAAYIGDAIESLRKQTYPPHEIIVCDDGSTDDLGTALAPYRHLVELKRQENRGVAAEIGRASCRERV